MFSKEISLFLLISNAGAIFAFNANLSINAFSQCKEYQIDGEYKYREAFTISGMKNNKPYENEIFRMKFYVFTRNDAHILITNEPSVHIGEPSYEIVIGGDDNKESVIKMHKQGSPVIRKAGDVTSGLYPTEIVVTLKDDGELSVILPDYERPYMTYKDTSARFWTYVAFSSINHIPARWFYDCPLGNDGPSSNE